MKLLHIKQCLIWGLLTGLFLLSGCSNKDEEFSVTVNAQKLTLFYQQQTDIEVLTRTQTSNEMKINNLYAIFFERDSEAYKGVSVITLNKSEATGKVEFIMPVGLEASDKYYIYLLANLDGYVKNNSVPVKQWLDTALSGTTCTSAGTILEAFYNQPITTSQPMPMFSGKIDKNTSDKAVSGTVSLNRLVSRIDVYLDRSVLPLTKFRLEGVQLWNARTSSKLLTGSSLGLTNNGYVNHKTPTITPTLVGQEERIEGKLYTFPNFQATTTKGDKVTTCLIVKGKFNNATNATYYRLNIKAKGSRQDLLPNHRYLINITGVTGPGADNENDAIEDKLEYTDYKVTLDLLIYNSNNAPTSQGLTVDTKYTINSNFQGFPASTSTSTNSYNIYGVPKDYQGSRHLLLSATDYRILKYRFKIESSKSWNLSYKVDNGSAPANAITFSVKNSTELAASKATYVYVSATKEVPDAWSGKIVAKFSNGAEKEIFPVGQTGVFSYLLGSNRSPEKMGKIYYYGFYRLRDMIILDRDLGAVNNGYYTNSSHIGIPDSKNPDNHGAFFTTNTTARNACPKGWRLPKIVKDGNEEFGWMLKNWTFGDLTLGDLTYKYFYYYYDAPNDQYWFQPMCDFENSSPGHACVWFADNGGVVVMQPRKTYYYHPTWEVYASEDRGIPVRCVRASLN